MGQRGQAAMPYRDDCKDVWLIPPISSKDHPAPFPVEIPRRLIRLFTHAEDALIMDPCMGTGQMGLVAVELGRRFLGIDNQAGYMEVARSRLQDGLGKRGRCG
jgi:site-specific DNA-methyltransferase (adenine-specific)